MKAIPSLMICVFILLSCQSKTNDKKLVTEERSLAYDSTLAAETGADEYGMRQYVMAFLKSGPNPSKTKKQADSLQRAHLDNIKRMATDGKLVMAGPFMDNQELRGIYIFAVESIEEAEELTRTDPAIQAGSLIMELRPWYGSAALIKINEIHSQLSKISI